MDKTIVLAFGGNAIVKSWEKGSRDEQWNNIKKTCQTVAELLKQGHRIVITHGNGPQAGNILIKNEMAKDILPAMPLDVIVSNTQGAIGYAIAQTMGNYFASIGLDIPVVAIVTQVVVHPDDPAFEMPTKFIGPFFSREEAQAIMQQKGHIMREDSGRGWRRVVPSPEPIEIIEKQTIKKLLDEGVLVVAVGGGGIPVVRSEAGLAGVEAVIDKDMAGQCLADDIGADMLIVLTEVDRVCINFGKPDQKELPHMTVAEAKRYQEAGQFPPGSMGPKVEAAIRFALSGAGRQSAIVSLENAHKVFTGERGTIITQ